MLEMPARARNDIENIERNKNQKISDKLRIDYTNQLEMKYELALV